MIKDIKEDFSELIKKEEFNIVEREIAYLRKDLGRLCTKDEVMTRLNVFNAELSTKLHERPTIAYFKKVLTAYDSKIESFNQTLKKNMAKLDETQADQDHEIDLLDK